MSEDSFEIVSSYYASAERQGDVGEALTAYELRRLGITVLRNLYFPYNGHLTEVDMIGLSRYGIFIIENKNYNGVVTGDEKDKFWYVNYSILYKRKLLNPVIQNTIHKNTFLELPFTEDLDKRYVFNTVIFNDKCQLKVTNVDKNVFRLSDFVDVYKGFVNDREPLIYDDIIRHLNENLVRYSDCSDFMRLLHVYTLKETQK